MRLLIDAATIGSPGGIRLRDELIRSIQEYIPEDSTVVLLVTMAISKFAFSPKSEVLIVQKPRWGWFGRWKWFHYDLPKIARENNADVFYSLTGFLSKNLCRSLATISTVNNMIPFMPEVGRLYPFFSKYRIRHAILHFAFVGSLKIADAVVLHSKHALEAINAVTEISSKTCVVLTGCSTDSRFEIGPHFVHPYKGLPYFLYFSTIYPYKNHLRLIEAYYRANQKKLDLPILLIAGLPQDNKYLKQIQLKIEKLDLGGKVKYIGIFRREDIPVWLHYAEINFFPSICETNPVTMSEILSSNGVLACSGVAPMSEVAAYAAELFDPYSVESITNVILRLSNNQSRCNDLRRMAKKRAAELSWSECGKVVWKAVKMAETAFKERRNN
jgi:glycosyltransferase involved in cell wall biosynthesis